jgi:hypothetical protein
VGNLLIDYFHGISGHSGREHVLTLLREKYWIIRANTSDRAVLSKCGKCLRNYSKPGQQKMADLPQERLKPNRPPFHSTGIDCFGPLVIRRGRSDVKMYGVIFTCMNTRAVHLELAESLDTSSFIMALRRFIARRGQVRYIISDNGSNFVSSEKELKKCINEWNKNQINDMLLQKNINWEFNPPYGSHVGGLWERCIRSVRKILTSLTSEQTLKEESLRTLLCEVEAILNSRPLTTVLSDSKDLQPLTPNDLLLLCNEMSMPPGIFSKTDVYSRKRWRQIQYMADIFWVRWKREYLVSLQQRTKWQYPKHNLQLDDVVLLVDINTPRNLWVLGRVCKVFPDHNGFIRQVEVKTRNAILRRPVDKLCLLTPE